MAAPLIGILRRSARIVLTFWPALLAWFLFGVLGRYVFIQLAGWVGASHFGLGIGLMPIAILCRLVAFVAMLLVVREALPILTSTSPVPSEPRQRRRQFVDALLAGILPFFAFYLAWGLLRDDMGSFYNRVLDVQSSQEAQFTAQGDLILDGPLGLSLTWVTGIAIVVTFILRRVAKRYSSRSARVLPVIAVYLEALWVMLFALVVTDLMSSVASWFTRRQGIAWLVELRRSIAAHLAPLDWLLTVGGWLIGEIGGLILLPVAWLAIAGVVYGNTLAPSSPASRFLQRGRLAVLRDRAGRLPGWFRRRLTDIWDLLVEGVRPIGDAFKLMWHAGPLLISIYVLLFRGIEWISAELDIVVTHLIGPQPTDFWITYMPALLLIAPTLTAPFAIAVIASAYDLVIGRLRPTEASDAGGVTSDESQGFAPPVAPPLPPSMMPPPTAAP